jgi:hypothetical protein
LYRLFPENARTSPRRGLLYTHSLNNPLRYLDPDGRDILGVIKQANDTLADFCLGIVDAQIENGESALHPERPIERVRDAWNADGLLVLS